MPAGQSAVSQTGPRARSRPCAAAGRAQATQARRPCTTASSRAPRMRVVLFRTRARARLRDAVPPLQSGSASEKSAIAQIRPADQSSMPFSRIGRAAETGPPHRRYRAAGRRSCRRLRAGKGHRRATWQTGQIIEGEQMAIVGGDHESRSSRESARTGAALGSINAFSSLERTVFAEPCSPEIADSGYGPRDRKAPSSQATTGQTRFGSED